MSSWAMVAIVAIIVWGIVQSGKSRRHKERSAARELDERTDAEAQREIESLRERIKVLERIATDGNSLDAQETKRISTEIEALRDKQAD